MGCWCRNMHIGAGPNLVSQCQCRAMQEQVVQPCPTSARCGWYNLVELLDQRCSVRHRPKPGCTAQYATRGSAASGGATRSTWGAGCTTGNCGSCAARE